MNTLANGTSERLLERLVVIALRPLRSIDPGLKTRYLRQDCYRWQ